MKLKALKYKYRKISLRHQFSLSILISFLIAAASVFGMYAVTNHAIDYYYHDTDKWNAKTLEKAKNLQEFIDTYELSSYNRKSLEIWANANPSIYFRIYADERPVFEVEGYEAVYSDIIYQELSFIDCNADMDICYTIDYSSYYFLITIETVLGLALFLFLSLIPIVGFLNEIARIDSDVRTLKYGNLDHEIKVTGRGELRKLEKNLENLRISVKENIRREEALTTANNELVTRMSHDLRTPLTSLLLYLDLLQKRKYSNDEQFNKYINVSRQKAEQIKEMSDLLFERFLVTGSSEEKDLELMPSRYALEDTISGFVMILEAYGFKTVTDISWPDTAIIVSQRYLGRVFDNLYSNITKYAEHSTPIEIRVSKNKNGLTEIMVQNRFGSRSILDGSGIGTENISIMMEKMGGSVAITDEDNVYRTELVFAADFK